MGFQGAIFDMDGTLLDTLTDIAEAANDALAELKFPTFPVEDYRYFVGDGVKVLMARLLPQEFEQNEEVHEKFLQLYSKYYSQKWNQNTQPYRGIPELLNILQQKNFRLGILSNKPHAFTVKCAEKILADWKFDFILGQKDEIPRKPDPAGAIIIRDAWSLSSSEILYFGDTGTDMLTAKRAGFYALGVTWGFRPEDELREAGADLIIHHPLDVLSLLDS